jgi:hypothetical protein
LVSFLILTFHRVTDTTFSKPIRTTIIRGFSFSWKRLLGITGVKQQIARGTGIPTTQSGLERKIGNTVII